MRLGDPGVCVEVTHPVSTCSHSTPSRNNIHQLLCPSGPHSTQPSAFQQHCLAELIAPSCHAPTLAHPPSCSRCPAINDAQMPPPMHPKWPHRRIPRAPPIASHTPCPSRLMRPARHIPHASPVASHAPRHRVPPFTPHPPRRSCPMRHACPVPRAPPVPWAPSHPTLTRMGRLVGWRFLCWCCSSDVRTPCKFSSQSHFFAAANALSVNVLCQQPRSLPRRDAV